MITVGIDLAAQPERTAACSLEWNSGGVTAIDLTAGGVDDARMLELIGAADVAGLDVPLGWPDDFVAAMAAHHALLTWPAAEARRLRMRLTDQRVHERTGRWPLSVSTDRIAIPAFRAARVLSQLPFTFDRGGGGRVVEVYPAGTLTIWGFDSRRYKRIAGAAARGLLIAAFRERTERWLRLDATHWDTCCASDDAFDALIAALTARAAARGLIDRCAPAQAAVASREGWIALPAGDSLDRLA